MDTVRNTPPTGKPSVDPRLIEKACELLGGKAAATTVKAMAAAGMPHSRSAVSLARQMGVLPVRETIIRHRFYVSAADFAAAFLVPSSPDPQPDPAPVRRRGPGRPRKTVPDAVGDV